MRKAMKALMAAYQRHMLMEEASSTQPPSGCWLPTTPRPRSRRPMWWDLDYILDRQSPRPAAPGLRRHAHIDDPVDLDYNHLA